MFYIVQENTFRETNYDILVHSLERLGLPYDIVKSTGFSDDIFAFDSGLDAENPNAPEKIYTISDEKREEYNIDNVFVFGSIKLARTSKLNNWYPASLLNDNHDYDIYKQHWKDELLNYDSKIIKFADPIEWKSSEELFIRPCEDTKVFTGTVFVKEEWEEFVQSSLTNGHSTSLDKDTRIQVSSVKEIQKEIRCWVVGKHVITASQYRLGHNTTLSADVDADALEYASKMVELFQLADAFVIDICLTEINGVSTYKIVEAGCINSAGFYKADMMKVIMALEDYYSPAPTNHK